MGTFGGYSSLRELKAELTATQYLGGQPAVCWRHCYRGNAYTGVVWSVWEQDPGSLACRPRWIRCDVVRYTGEGWEYKPLREADGPCYYSCPLRYLRMVPDDQEGVNPEWRAKVQAYHEERRRRRCRKTVAI